VGLALPQLLRMRRLLLVCWPGNSLWGHELNPNQYPSSPTQTKRKVEELSHANVQLSQELDEMMSKYEHKCK
jgi:hypothetical protein